MDKGLEQFLEGSHCNNGDKLEYKTDFNDYDTKKYGSVYKGFCLVEDVGCKYCKSPDDSHYFCTNPIREVKYENNNSVNDSSVSIGKRRKHKQRKH